MKVVAYTPNQNIIEATELLYREIQAVLETITIHAGVGNVFNETFEIRIDPTHLVDMSVKEWEEIMTWTKKELKNYYRADFKEIKFEVTLYLRRTNPSYAIVTIRGKL